MYFCSLFFTEVIKFMKNIGTHIVDNRNKSDLPLLCEKKRRAKQIYPFSANAGSLREHSQSLPAFAEIMREHSQSLPAFAETLREHSRSLPAFAETLREHSQSLPAFAEIMREHSRSLPAFAEQRRIQIKLQI